MAGTIKQSGHIKIWDVTLTVAAAGNSATATSPERFAGTIRKVCLDPGAAMATSATLKGYETNTPLATGTRDHFIDYVFPASEVELVIYPTAAGTLNTGAAPTPTISLAPVVCDYLTLDLASAAAADSTRVRVYVEV